MLPTVRREARQRINLRDEPARSRCAGHRLPIPPSGRQWTDPCADDTDARPAYGRLPQHHHHPGGTVMKRLITLAVVLATSTVGAATLTASSTARARTTPTTVRVVLKMTSAKRAAAGRL